MVWAKTKLQIRMGICICMIAGCFLWLDGAAQTPDSTGVTHIDYYSGRMIEGIGICFDQNFVNIKDEKEGFEYTPCFYYYLHPKLSVTFLNQTTLNILEMGPDIMEKRYPSISTSLIRGQYRPNANIQLFPFMEMYRYNTDYVNSDVSTDVTVEEKNKYTDGGLEGIVQLGDPELALSGDVISWMYYSGDSLRFVPAGDALIEASVRFRDQTLDIDPLAMSDSTGQLVGQTGDVKRHAESLRLVYGLTDRLMFNMRIRYTHSKTFDKYQLSTQPDTEESSDAFFVGSGLDWLGYWGMCNRLSISYENQDLENVNRDKELRAGFNYKVSAPRLQIDYSGHWMSSSPDVSQDQLLANANHIFAVRLPAGIWGACCHVTYQNHNQKEQSSVQMDNQKIVVLKQQDKIRKSQINLESAYGISDYLEIGLLSDFWLFEFARESPAQTAGASENAALYRSYQRKALRAGFEVAFGNYVFRDQWLPVYGWNKLSPMEQLNGPMLEPGLFKGTVQWKYLLYHDEDAAIFPYQDGQYYITENRHWNAEGDLQLGLCQAMMLHCSGAYYHYQKRLRNFMDEDWRVHVNWVWQALDAVRITFGYQTYRLECEPYRQLYNASLSRKRTIAVWELGVMAHF